MAGRIRTIKPELLDDEIASSLSDSAWRLWISTWVLADDQGNARAGDKYLAAQAWQDTAHADRVPPLLRELERAGRSQGGGGMIEVYEVQGQRYLHINGWEKHQRMDNAGKPRVPGPDKADSNTWTQSRGGSLRVAAVPEVASPLAALPPTSDQRSPTTTTDQPCALPRESSPGVGEPTPPLPAPTVPGAVPEQATPPKASGPAVLAVQEPGKRRGGGKPKAPADPAPYTIRQLEEAFTAACPDRVSLTIFDQRLAKPLYQTIRACPFLADVEVAAHFLSRGGRKWMTGAITWGWLAKAGNLTGLVDEALDARDKTAGVPVPSEAETFADPDLRAKLKWLAEQKAPKP